MRVGIFRVSKSMVAEMQYICSVVEPAGLISVEFLRRKFDWLNRVAQAGAREKAKLHEFIAIALRFSPEFRILWKTQRHRQGILLEENPCDVRIQECWF